MSLPESGRRDVRPPSAFRAAWLITRLEALRWLNRRPWKRAQKNAARSGTARKGAPAKLLLAFVSVIFALNIVSQLMRVLYGVAAAAEQHDHPGQMVLSHESMLVIEVALLDLSGAQPPSGEDELRMQRAFEQAAIQDDHQERALFGVTAERLARVYREHGRDGFVERELELSFWPSTALWYRHGDPLQMLMPLAAIGLLLTLAALFASVVGSDRDLARADSSLEWWFTFPVSARGLLLSRVCGTALVSPLTWLFVLPFFSLVFWCGGLGPWLGALLGLLATLYIGLLAGSLRVLAETVLRGLLPLRRVALVQAALEVLAGIPFLLAMLCTSPTGLSLLIEHTRVWPGAWLLNPLSLPLGLLLGGRHALLSVLAILSVMMLSVWGALAVGSYMLRDGLSSSSGPLLGTRQKLRSAHGPARSLLSVIARRELLSIARDPGRVARVLVFPFMSLGFSSLADPSFFRALITSPSHASASAFGMGASVLLGGGLLSLNNEGAGLWLYYTTPCSIDGVLLRKAVVWSGLGLLISALSLLALALIARDLTFVLSGHALLALVGVSLYGFIVVPLGALGTDVLESERARRMQPFTAQLFLLLTAMFFFALYVPSLWAKFAQLSLSGLLAFALWQKLRDHTPYFLDPTEAPPPRIAVSDGIFAALAFFVLQGLLGLLFTWFRLSAGLSVLFAFVGAGLVVTASSLYIFTRMRVPQLASAIGWSAEGAKPLRAISEGLLAGALGGLLALLYAAVIERFAWLRELTEPEPLELKLRPFLYALAVFAAPLFEELIFRGILYRGFRRSLRPLHAALASSLVFALMHPPLAFVPVFMMAMLAATVFERSRLLLASIVAHMTYNTIIVLLSATAAT